MKSKRDRIESSSFQMDPTDIEHVTHKSQVYSVISKPFKQAERDPNMKPYRSSPNILAESHAQSSQWSKKKEGNFPPSRPPPPFLLKKQASAGGLISDRQPRRNPPPTVPPPRPPSESSILRTDDDYADYTEVDDTSPISSTDNSPFHRPSGAPPIQIKQHGNHVKKSSKDSDKILLDIRTQSHHPHTAQVKPKPTDHSSKPSPPTRPPELSHKPLPATKPSDLTREHKKHELHQKYSKIREDIIRKQGQLDVPGSGQARGASPSVPQVKERHMHGVRDHKEEVKAHARPKPPKGYKQRSRPSYAEVEPDLEITVEPVPNRVSQADVDNTMWMRVKYPTMPRGESMGKRSSSSSNITSSDNYSNLAELQLDQSTMEGSGSDSLGRRRHSFSEGEERMIIRASVGSR